MSNKIYTVYLVDDHETTLTGVKTFLESNEAFKVIGMNTSSNLALQEIIKKEPDIAIIDYYTNGMDGIQLIESITKTDKSIKCILMSYRGDADLIYEAKKVGAKGFISKGEPNKEILNIIMDIAMRNQLVFKNLDPEFVPNNSAPLRILNEFDFKPAEIAVIHLMLEGCPTAEISQRTNKTYFSVNSLRRDINKKIKSKGFNNFTHFAGYAKRLNLFD